MKTIKIILGILLSYGLLMGGLPVFFEDLSNRPDADTFIGGILGIIIFGSIIFYLFYSAFNTTKKSK
jgi:hypothetical protein